MRTRGAGVGEGGGVSILDSREEGVISTVDITRNWCGVERCGLSFFTLVDASKFRLAGVLASFLGYIG